MAQPTRANGGSRERTDALIRIAYSTRRRGTSSAILEVVEDSADLLVGYEVNREGARISGRGFDQRVRMISQSLVVERTPMVMNLHYGELMTDEAVG